jgi:hypothetical protein
MLRLLSRFVNNAFGAIVYCSPKIQPLELHVFAGLTRMAQNRQ